MSEKTPREKRAIFEKVANNPNIPESAREIARKSLEKLDAEMPNPDSKKEKVEKQLKAKKEKVEKQQQPKKEKVSNTDEYDCDDLIKKAKETHKKRKIAAEKRASTPKKKPATKIKEGIETISDKIDGSVEKGNVSKAELEKLIASTKALLSRLEKQLKQFTAKKMAEGGNVEQNINEKVLRFLTKEKKDEVLNNISKHYKISKQEALEEVTDNDSERLYEYIANNAALRMSVYDDYHYVNGNKFAKGGSIKRTKTAIEDDKNLRAMPKGERLSHPFAIIRKANGKTFKRRNANQFGKVEGDEVYREYRSNRTDKDQKKRF